MYALAETLALRLPLESGSRCLIDSPGVNPRAMSRSIGRIAILWWTLGLALIASLAYAGLTLSRIAPIGTGYAAKILCTGVFVSGRPAQQVIDEDIQAGVHPLLHLVHPTVDVQAGRARATFLGMAAREAWFRPGLGCTLKLGDALAGPATMIEPASNRAPPNATPATNVHDNALHAVVDSAFDEPDPLNSRRTRALVVMQNGRIIAQRFAPGFSEQTPLIGWSMSKSIIAALIGVLVGEGKLSPDATALLSEWRGREDARARVTLDELLRMTSGLQFNEDYDDPLSDVAIMLFAEADQSAYAARKPLDFAPGARWEYSSGTTEILSRVIRQALGGTERDYLAFPRRALFEPLGMRTAVFEADAAGILVGASFVCASAGDWARFGQLLLQDGVWDGKRILPPGWVRYMREVTLQSPRRDYGAHIWVKVPEPFDSHASPPPALPPDAFHLVGHEGQFVSVVPSRELVVVRMGLSRPEKAWDHETFLARLIEALPSAPVETGGAK